MHPHTHARASACKRCWSDGARTRARLHARAVCSLTTRGTLHMPLILNRQERARAKPGQGYKRKFTAESRRLSRQLRADVFDWRKILSGKKRGRQPVNEAARRTASLLRQPSQEGGLRRPSEKETNREPSSEENGVRSQLRKETNRGTGSKEGGVWKNVAARRR